MKIIIHRGADEIGGSCIEVEHDGKSILLDYGSPLNTDAPMVPETLMPERINAIIASHLHQDHIGMANSLGVTFNTGYFNHTFSLPEGVLKEKSKEYVGVISDPALHISLSI